MSDSGKCGETWVCTINAPMLQSVDVSSASGDSEDPVAIQLDCGEQGG